MTVLEQDDREVADRRIRTLAAEGMSERDIAEDMGFSRWRVRRALSRVGVVRTDAAPRREGERVGLTVTGDTAAVVLPAGAGIGDVETMLRDRGFDPADWHVERVTVNEWEALAPEGRVVQLRQLKAHLRSRLGVVGPAREVESRYVPERGLPRDPHERLIAVMGDQQAPYHDPELHRAVLRWLVDVEPSAVVLTGDTLDFPTISRHRDRIGWNAGVQECVDTGFRLLSDYRDAAPSAEFTKLRGNHDWRLESEIMDRAERMAFVRPAERDGDVDVPHLYSVRRLLHLDELGIGLAGVEGDDWRFGEVVLAPGLVVRHEPPSQSKAARLNRSVMAGHTHRQGIRCMTTFDENDEPVVRSIVDVGCLARTREGLGYAERPDWQAGFATVSLGRDGSMHFDLAAWRSGVLTWRGDRWHGR